MKESFPTEITIREYLLGRLDDQPETEDRLSQQMLFNEELSEIVDSMEEEIIEDYLDGTLDAGDKKAVEEYFLRPAERKEKLRFARDLREGFARKNDFHAQPHADAPVQSVRDRLVSHWRVHYRTYAGLAALVLLIVSSLVYVTRVRHELQSQIEAGRRTQMDLEKRLEQQRQHSTDVAKRLEKYEPRVAGVTFYSLLRDTGEKKVARIWPGTEQIRVEIEILGASGRTYDVRVQTKSREQVWTQTALKASADALTFDVPRQLLSAGDYCVEVSSQAKPYCFQVKVEK